MMEVYLMYNSKADMQNAAAYLKEEYPEYRVQFAEHGNTLRVKTAHVGGYAIDGKAIIGLITIIL